jgi:hypothetical protein
MGYSFLCMQIYITFRNVISCVMARGSMSVLCHQDRTRQQWSRCKKLGRKGGGGCREDSRSTAVTTATAGSTGCNTGLCRTVQCCFSTTAISVPLDKLKYYQCTYNVTLRRVRNHCCRTKRINITYLCVCVCARASVHVAMCLIVTSLLVPLAPPYFSTLSHNRHDFRKKNVLNIKCVLILFITSVYNISHSK